LKVIKIAKKAEDGKIQKSKFKIQKFNLDEK